MLKTIAALPLSSQAGYLRYGAAVYQFRIPVHSNPNSVSFSFVGRPVVLSQPRNS